MKKKYRVKNPIEFQHIIHKGSKFANMSFVLYVEEKGTISSRIGISLSKKIGNAVERNKIKRQVRMMCQELIDFDTYPKDLIIIVRFGYKNLNYINNKKNLEKLLNKATIK